MIDNMQNMQTVGQIGYNKSSFLPKINMQVIILSLIAIITLFQTFQLVRINAKASSAAIKSSVPAASSGSQPQNAASSSDVPQSMVGGC